MTRQDSEDVLCFELSGRQRQRFERIRAECTDDYLPEPTDEQILKSLIDTWDAVADGHYSGGGE